ncbi:MAG: mechanosensitive ion channel family protein [Myxococcales bacterium]|nr:mechanosensitive ion channel family protein [Myxococcales bacterium]MCB9735918.1 mechanosensitive ion channel family protein [Deltaproteobacteria bacterium]
MDFDWDTFMSDAWPWIWPSVTLIAWLVLGFYLVRRLLRFLLARAEKTVNPYDDELVPTLRRPLQVGVLIAGLALWRTLAPLPPGTSTALGLVTKGAITLVIVLVIDGIIQTWMAIRARSSNVLATTGHVLRIAARVVVYIVGALMMLSNMGIDVTPIVASLGVGSLAIGLALQKTLEDFFSGLLLAADQPVRIGDWVEFDGLTGSVISIGWRSSRILTLHRTYVIVPNSVLAQSKLINRSFPDENFQFQAEVGVGYETDLDRVIEILRDVVTAVHREDKRATPDFKPIPVCKGFGDSSIDFAVWCSSKSWGEHFGLKDVVVRAIRRRFAQDGINIPFPIRTLDVPKHSVDALMALRLPSPPPTDAAPPAT